MTQEKPFTITHLSFPTEKIAALTDSTEPIRARRAAPCQWEVIHLNGRTQLKSRALAYRWTLRSARGNSQIVPKQAAAPVADERRSAMRRSRSATIVLAVGSSVKAMLIKCRGRRIALQKPTSPCRLRTSMRLNHHSCITTTVIVMKAMESQTLMSLKVLE